MLNYGSLNYDTVYTVNHIVKPGETISSLSSETFLGGKGLNQSVALARAGVHVQHAGMIGENGQAFLDFCLQEDIDTTMISMVSGASGQAIIQLDEAGENSIIVSAEANRKNSAEKIEYVLSHFSAGDIVLLQNEINMLTEIMDAAYEKGMRVVLNPSPISEEILVYDFSKIFMIVANLQEGQQLTGEQQPHNIVHHLLQRYPHLKGVLTMGKQGAIYFSKEEMIEVKAFDVKTIDTTAAGDTFTGFFIASICKGQKPIDALKAAAAAAALATTVKGAIPSIPGQQQVNQLLLGS